MSETAAENTGNGRYDPAAPPPAADSPAADSPAGGQAYGVYPDEGTQAGLQILTPRSAETAVIEYDHPADPLLVPKQLLGLDARNISAWFGTHKVLERVSLAMEPGTVTALIGPSGCGKSTFLRILNRMHEMINGASLAGEVLLGGDDIYGHGTRPSDVRRRIGMVFQKPNPFPAMSIYDNVASGLKLAGIKVANKDAVVESSLRRAGLWNEVYRRLRAPGGGLSGGQQQRLCIARALAVSPAVLLMDEPCSALDPTSTRRIEETIAELENQVTIVIVTHNMQQAQRVSRNCAFFLAAEDTPGHIVETGPTEELFDNPTDPRTADYVHGRFG
jgi:phosphate transport system ATP-binding protein